MTLFFLSLCTIAFSQRSPKPIVHDPVAIEQDGKYYIFCTGKGIKVYTSNDLINWQSEPAVFEKAPDWTYESVSGFEGHIWAPDISFFNGLYYLYYSVSAFGKNTSCIGLVTNKTLDSSDPDFSWVDRGKIIQSYPGKTNWNAIDPNLILDDDGSPYLSFGSFWGGLQLVELSKDAMSINKDQLDQIQTIASRKSSPNDPNPPSIDTNPVDAGGNAIEAPFIFKKNDYYYLFASIDYCCKGEQSNYKMIVGRSNDISGPYIDKQGISMARGGGSILLEGDINWNGVGHNSTYNFNNEEYLIFHAYDANWKGIPVLRILKLNWDENLWPIADLDSELNCKIIN